MPRAPPQEYSPSSTSGVSTRYKFSSPSTRQLSADLESVLRSIWRFTRYSSLAAWLCGFGVRLRGFALPASLIQNSRPYALRSTSRTVNEFARVSIETAFCPICHPDTERGGGGFSAGGGRRGGTAGRLGVGG